MQELGKTIMIIGAVLLAIGAALYFQKSLPFLGKLPGDILILKKKISRSIFH